MELQLSVRTCSAGVIGLAIAVVLTVAFVKGEVKERLILPPIEHGYSQGKFDSFKALSGTTNLPTNPFNNRVPSPKGGSDTEEDMDK